MSRDPWEDAGYGPKPLGSGRKFDPLVWGIAILAFLIAGGVIFAIIYAINWA